MMNHVHVRVSFWNNYGVHKVNVKSKPRAFLWDWIGVAAPIAGTGCVRPCLRLRGSPARLTHRWRALFSL